MRAVTKSKPCRFIVDLYSAEACSRPPGIPKSRARGRKAAGLRYERELANAIPRAKHGQWFRFVDKNGLGVCQPDLLLRTQFGIAILESKYTWTETGHMQLDRLYIPVVEKVWARTPAFGIVVCKVLGPGVHPDWICRDLATAIGRAASGRKTVLHWIGAGLGPLQIAA